MFDIQQFLIPLEKKKAVILSDSDWGLEEMEGLFTTLGGETVEGIKVQLRRIEPRTYIGEGKLQEIADHLVALGVDVLLVDFDLSPSQMKNIELVANVLVLDRSGIILEIFSRHARTKEAKLQVEVARLEYLMPRLTNLWTHFERQSGAGGTSLKGKGMGEKQIEVDRRLIKDRISMLRKKLKDVDDARNIRRRSREEYLKVALVGYTNAGKSTLLNALTHSEVLVEDSLFATLDASVRVLNPKARPLVMAIDTVGFIDRLPHSLVASFRSTLSEVLAADLLLHVVDASSHELERQFEVTLEVLGEIMGELAPVSLQEQEAHVRAGQLETPVPMLLVINKIDRCSPEDFRRVKIWAATLQRKYGLPPALFVSALKPESVSSLREEVLKFFETQMEVFEVVVPFEDGRTLAQISEFGRVEVRRTTNEGTFLKFRTTHEFAQKFKFERYRI